MTNLIIQQAEEYVKKQLESVDASHDFSHIDRVRKTALKLATPDCNMLLVELSALLHDVGDFKYTKEY